MRVTYQFSANHWPFSIGPDAERVNNVPKLICSRTLRNGKWLITREHVSVPFSMDGSYRAGVDLKPELLEGYVRGIACRFLQSQDVFRLNWR